MFGATLTVPSALTVSGPVVTGVMVTSAGTTATPFSVSLPRTLSAGTMPPDSPLAEPVSSTAMSGASVNVMTVGSFGPGPSAGFTLSERSVTPLSGDPGTADVAVPVA